MHLGLGEWHIPSYRINPKWGLLPSIAADFSKEKTVKPFGHFPGELEKSSKSGENEREQILEFRKK